MPREHTTTFLLPREIDGLVTPRTMNPIFAKSFLTSAEAEALLASVQALRWTRGRFMGSNVPRDEIWMGPYPYKFSGRILKPARWTPEIAALRDRIQEQYGGRYNSVLLNRYLGGKDSVSWHSDSEPEMDSKHPIASISLGASRELHVRSIRTKEVQPPFVLTSGSLFIMRAGFQEKYEHRVPKTKTSVGVRVNFTFRRMKQDSAPTPTRNSEKIVRNL
jgi:alkylated DNA repair dioxygenase AlkB